MGTDPSPIASCGSALTELMRKLKECERAFVDWAAEQCAQSMIELCGAAGRMAYAQLRRNQELRKLLPPWLLERPCPIESAPDAQQQYALWWLAVLSCLEQNGQLNKRSASGVSFHGEVFSRWRPNLMFYKHPYVRFHPGLCKQYGAASCLQSIDALQRILGDPPVPRVPQHEVATSRGATTHLKTLRKRAVETDKVHYVGCADSQVYHVPGCPMLRRIRPERLITYSRRPHDRRPHSACAGASNNR